jgi:hypothetical protein
MNGRTGEQGRLDEAQRGRRRGGRAALLKRLFSCRRPKRVAGGAADEMARHGMVNDDGAATETASGQSKRRQGK